MSSPPSNPRTTPTAAPRARATGPRAGVTRKTKAEREKYAAEQAERDKKRGAASASGTSASNAAGQNTAGRGRGGGSRGGRGGGGGDGAAAQRDNTHVRPDGSGGGVFGSNIGAARRGGTGGRGQQQGQEEWISGAAAAAAAAARREDLERGGSAAGGGGGGASGSNAGTGGGGGVADSSVPQRVVDPAIMVLEDDEPEEERRDIERIWISSDDEGVMDEDEDDIITSKGKQRAAAAATTAEVKPRKKTASTGAGLRPVRARARQTQVADDTVDDETTTSHRTMAAGRGKRESTAAPITIDDSDAMDLDPTGTANERSGKGALQPLTKAPSSSPELKKRTLATKPRPAARGRDARAHAAETIEERAERLRVTDETQRLLDILGPNSNGTSASASATAKGKGKQAVTDGDDASPAPRLFLMQFPPITPLLVDPIAEAEEAAATAAAASAAAASAENNAANEKKLTTAAAPDVVIKSEPGTAGDTSLAPQQDSEQAKLLTKIKQQGYLTAADLTPPNAVRLPTGKVGTLRVHASGKVSLDWGGCDMLVGMGGKVDFLVEGVGVDSEGGMVVDGDGIEGGGDGGEGGNKGKVYALGQVQGKLIVTPDWESLHV